MVKVLDTELFDQELPAAIAIVLARCQTTEKQNLLISATGPGCRNQEILFLGGLASGKHDGYCSG